MNSGQAQNDFLQGLMRLLEEADRELEAGGPEPYVGAGQGQVLEHQTRVRFFDRLVSLLGWDLDVGGNMAEEARIRAETTTYMDYLGVTQGKAPAVLWEVKAWDRPFISRVRGRKRQIKPVELLIEAIQHFNAGGAKESAPVIGEWHEHIEQVAGYVRGLERQHGHVLPRAVLSSGQWMVVFKAPAKTFIDLAVSEDDIVVLTKEEFVANAASIYALLARQVVARSVPFPLRPTQLPLYVTQGTMRAAFRCVHVHYHGKGSSFYAPKPQVVIYPVILNERTDGVLLTTASKDFEFELTVSKWTDEEGNRDRSREQIDDHVAAVTQGSDQLVASCTRELGFELLPQAIDIFGGFPRDRQLQANGLDDGRFVMQVPHTPNEWLVVTGVAPHFLRTGPLIAACRFHAWASCERVGQALLESAINFPKVAAPRSFFVDGQKHHCAHQGLDDRREPLCHIRAIDQRVCCQTCLFSTECWKELAGRPLPCGS